MDEAVALAGLFATAFGAATIFPFQSEIVFADLLLGEATSAAAIIALAGVANTLGSVLNWSLELNLTS